MHGPGLVLLLLSLAEGQSEQAGGDYYGPGQHRPQKNLTLKERRILGLQVERFSMGQARNHQRQPGNEPDRAKDTQKCPAKKDEQNNDQGHRGNGQRQKHDPQSHLHGFLLKKTPFAQLPVKVDCNQARPSSQKQHFYFRLPSFDLTAVNYEQGTVSR